jgi:hypothetical protein
MKRVVLAALVGVVAVMALTGCCCLPCGSGVPSTPTPGATAAVYQAPSRTLTAGVSMAH